MADGPVFPAFLKLEYQRDNSAKDTFLAEMASITTDAQRNFKQSFDEIGNIVKRSLSGFRSGEFRIDLDTSTLRQAANDAEFAASRLAFTRDAATRLAAATGDTSQATQTYLQALRAQTIEAERNAGAAREQVTTYSRLQAEIDRTIGKNQQLAASYRATFEEQAKATNFAHAYQQGINQVFAPGLAGPSKRARDSASVFEEQSYAPKADIRSGLDRMLDSAASLDRAAVSGVSLEQVLGRVATKGKEVSSALKDAADQAARAAAEEARAASAAGPSPRNAAPTNSKTGADALAAGAAAIDRSAISATTLDQVLGRVANKGQEVASALRETERATKQAVAQQEELLSLQIQSALAVKRNDNGALDLNVAGLQAEAAALKARAVAAQEVASAMQIAAREQGDFSAETQTAIKAAQQLAAQEQQAASAAEEQAVASQRLQEVLNRQSSATDQVVNATRRGTTESSNVVNGIRAQRVAFIQLGQQMQDVVVQTQMGTNATTIFVQQVPQMAFALSGLAENTNKTYARIGQFASFLAGPWGAAIFAASAVLGPIIASTIKFGDETDKATDKLKKQAEQTEITRRAKELFKKTEEGLRAAILDQKEALDKNVKSLQTEAQQARDLAKANLEAEVAIRKVTQAKLEQAAANENAANFGAQIATNPDELVAAQQGAQYYNQRQKDLADALKRNAALIEQAKKSFNTAQSLVDVEQGKKDADPIASIKRYYDELIEKARKRAAAEGKVGDALEKQVAALQKQSDAAVKTQRESQRPDTGALNRANDLGNMVALIKQLFPGAAITSTNTGKHTAGSDHYKDRAIDFVPSGGMGTYTKAEVEEILKGAGVDIRRNAKGVEQFFGPGDKGHSDHFHVAWQGSAPDPDKVAAAAQRAQAKLDAFGQRSSEAIARVNERFNEQPRLIDEAAQSTRQLDDVIAELEKRRPPGFEAMIAQAGAAKQSIEDALVRPYRELQRDSDRRIQQQQLLSQGREAEANALQDIWRLEDRLGPMTAERRAEVLRIAEAEQKQVEALRRAQEVQQAYLDTTRSIRSAVEGILGGYGKLSDLKNIGQQLQGKIMAEKLFGDVFADMDKWVKEKTGIGSSVDMLAKETDRAGSAAGQFADTIIAATNRLAAINSPSSSTSAGAGSVWDLKSISVPALLAAPKSTPVAANENPPIIVNGKVPARPGKTVNDLTPERYFEEQKNKMRDALTSSLEKAGLGSGLAKTLAAPIAGALEGYMTTGTGFGAVLGGLKDLKGLPDGLSAAFGKAFGGAQTGSQVAGIGNAIGIKMNQTGAEIGGAIGSLIPIPGGQVIGSVVGGLLGNLFGKRPRGGGAVSQDSINVSANDGGITSSLDSFGGALQNSITKIADALGGTVGSYDVGIGRYKEYYQVSGVGNDKALGNSYFQNRSSTALYDGTDAEAAMRAAILGAINDGAVKGIREGSIRLLKAGKDLDAQIQKAVDFQNVFKKLKSYTDPVGAALDTLDAEFDKLKQTFTEAGASAQEFADLQKLYGIERTNAVKQAMDQITGSLQSLMNDLTIGNDALSLRDRKAAALAAYQPLEARVKAGDTTAYADYADAARQLLDVERQMSGSQSDYFALLDEVKSITQTQLDSAKSVANASANRDSPFAAGTGTGGTGTPASTPANDNAGIKSAFDAVAAKLLDGLGYKLDAVNQNLGSLIQQGQTNSVPAPSYDRLLGTGSW